MDDLLTPLLEPFSESTVDLAALIVLASVLIPVMVAVALWAWRDPDRAEQGAIALSTTWNVVGLLAINAIAVQVGWWTFVDAGPAILGVSILLCFGWVILWGVVAPLLRWRPSIIVAGLAAFDLVFMPLLHGVLDLGPDWLVGEVAALALVAWPGLLLHRWSVQRSRLAIRVGIQVVMFSAMLLWAIPALTVGTWTGSLVLNVPSWAYGAVLFGVGGAALPAITAVHDFYLNGGSPWPWDSTDRPVRSGPYRYVRSPMQASGVLVLLVTTLLYGEPIIAVAALSALLYGRLFCAMEAGDLERRFGAPWADLALSLRRWIPQWKPHPAGEPAVVWINFDCTVCSPIADFLVRRKPQNLTVRPAAEHDDLLYRLRYERGDGATFDGVPAVGACLEHVHLGWAMIGWTLRLPVVWRLWQLVGDAVGFDPRPARAGAPGTSIDAGERTA